MSSPIPRYYSSSELSSFSDSDWLDISSSHDSEDDRNSDFENDATHRPPSRISSASFESSQDDGEIDTWEGFVEDAPANAVHDAHHTHVPLTNAAVASLNEGGRLVEEEERVKEALDQSMMSTLSASRSSSANTRTPLNDLRLSFPDPLSSQETLSRTPFEQLSTPSLGEASDGSDNLLPPTSNETDPGLNPTPVISHSDWCQCSHAPWQGLNVILYGLPSHVSFVREFLGAASRGFHHAEGCEGAPRLNLEAPFDGNCLGVSVHIQYPGAPMAQCVRDESSPSLAIAVYPFAPITLPAHSLYIPVIADPVNQDQSRAAWKLSGISPERTLILKADKRFSTVDEPVDPIRAYEALNRLRIKASRSRKLEVTPAFTPALTLTGIFSLLVGIAIYAACRGASIAGTPTVPIDRSTTTPLHQLITHSPVGTSLSIINTKTSLLPPTVRNTAISTVNQDTAVSKFTAAEACISVNMKPLVSWTERLRTSKDIMARPISSLLPVSTPGPKERAEVIVIEDDKDDVKEKDSEPSFLSEIFSSRIEEMKEEFNELSVALDDLMKSISVQTASLVEQSRESARLLKERAQRRHERARTRAKVARTAGERVIQSASKEMKDRVEKARQRAHTIRQCSTTPLAVNRVHGCWGQTRLKRFGL